jgi:hypothetical protein
MSERSVVTALSSRADLEARGFVGFESTASLRKTRCRGLPATPGVYVVARSADAPPRFRNASLGGWFKGKDPTVARDVLRGRWIEGTPILYVGKATSLRSRVRQLVDFGVGKPIGHWGGRLLWQVEGSASFLVAWQRSIDPRAEESGLLAEFVEAYGALPFANLSH